MPRIVQYYPDLIVLHISDAVAFAIKQTKFKQVCVEKNRFAFLKKNVHRLDFWVRK